MDMQHPLGVIGSNAWGGKAYGTILRGSYVAEDEIARAIQAGLEEKLCIVDTARDYGLGKGQPMVGRLCPKDIQISAKYTPTGKYIPGQVRASLERDLQDFRRSYVDIYWLHLPTDIQQNLREMAALYTEGKIHHIGVSNFNLAECLMAVQVLNEYDIPLYGVQNHYSLLARDWEESGLVAWCQERGISFWAWAVLEEGILVPPYRGERATVMKCLFQRKRRKLSRLYRVMEKVGERHQLSPAQVAICYVASKGIVPICGCRREIQVRQLAEAVRARLTAREIQVLEQTAARTGAHVLGADMFRFAVRR